MDVWMDKWMYEWMDVYMNDCSACGLISKLHVHVVLSHNLFHMYPYSTYRASESFISISVGVAPSVPMTTAPV